MNLDEYFYDNHLAPINYTHYDITALRDNIETIKLRCVTKMRVVQQNT